MPGRLINLCVTVVIWKWNLIFITAQENAALNKQAYQSSTWEKDGVSWQAQNAVNGDKSCDLVDGRHYSATDSAGYPWWKVDLGQLYNISNVKVFGQKFNNDQLSGFQLYLTSDNPDPDHPNSSSLVYTATSYDNTGTFSIPTSTAARYCLIRRQVMYKPLVLCEVEVLGTECSQITFGNNCSETCHCANNQSCYHSDGRLSCDRCAPGWMGNTCSTPCVMGTYGDNCAGTCSDHCLHGKLHCSSVTGQCDQGCKDGYSGPKCDSECALGTFGANCSKQCGHCKYNSSCDHVGGLCRDGCAPGYEPRDQFCKTECADATYGQDCALHCSTNCYNRESQCDKVTGECRQGCNDGYMGWNCTTMCEIGRFGRNCSEFCGQCQSLEECNYGSGICSNGCQPGYIGDRCRTECENGTFGKNCSNFCHCQNDLPCDKKSGTCPNGCDIMWAGNDCSEYNGFDFSRLVNATNQTGTFGSYEANLAIDKVSNYSIDTCQCCSVAENKRREAEVWWQIDLGKEYLIDAVSLFGRSDNSNKNQIQAAEVYAGNQSLSGNFSSGTLVYTVPSIIGNMYHFVHQLNSSVIARFFIVRLKQIILTLCEFHLRKEVCTPGSFGQNCLHACHCKGGAVCDPVTGYCESKQCESGWKGDACNSICSYRNFGDFCNTTCHCVNGTGCEHVNGICIAPQCDDGWEGSSCSSECSAGRFGVGCKYECHCIDGSKCHHINGTCERGLCDPGYTGISCADSKPVKASSQDSPGIGGVTGGASAAVVAVTVAIVIGIVMYRRHKSKLAEQQSVGSFSNLDKALRQQQQRRQDIYSSTHNSGHVNSAYKEPSANSHANTEAELGADGGGGYYDFTEVVGIRVYELWDYIQEKTKNDCEKLFEEFKKLPSGLIHPCTSADHLANRGKNRYREMYAYDRTRVVLEEKNDKGTDYVNANYVDGFNKTRKFVACQGPTKQMINDFWEMVWQLKSDKIVMLTNLEEQGGTKCILYWPKEEEFSYGKINVKIAKLDTDLDYDIRYLDVWKEGESPRRIRQYHFKSWPDKDVPDSTWCLVKFWRGVETDAESKAGPIVVHCSAGVGRTGTFIALDNLVHQARDEGCVRPFQIVQALRGQRVNMVQTKEQYVYLHEVLADALSFGTHFVWSTQFEAMYMSLLQREDGEAKIRLEVQYDLIQKSLKDTESKEAAEAPEYSNMELILSESDAYRPKLKKRGSKFVQRLGATFIPNYDGRNTFLVAMSPDKSTIEEFWSLVDDLNIKTVIMLTEKSSTCYKTSCDLGAQNDNGSKFHVNKLEEKIRKSYTERSFTFKESHREEDDHLVTVKQFEYTAWKDGYVVPGDARSLIDFLEEILKWQSHISESQPVLIYDSDGFSRSGIMCVALNEMQRINKEGGHINIVQSVKTMKQRKSQIIHSFEQYKFCYVLILAHLKHTEVYQNLK